jgi:hypothetical protein
MSTSHGTGRGAGERAVGSEHHLAHVVREADHGEHDVGTGRGRARRVGPDGAARQEPFGARRRASEDRDAMAAVEQMARTSRRP